MNNHASFFVGDGPEAHLLLPTPNIHYPYNLYSLSKQETNSHYSKFCHGMWRPPLRWWKLFFEQRYFDATSRTRDKNSEEQLLARQAVSELNRAVKSNELLRLSSCEICNTVRGTVAHHWAGYKFPLYVWWVCGKCNQRLRYLHDGRLKHQTEAKAYCYWSIDIDQALPRKRYRRRLLTIGPEQMALEIMREFSW